MKTLWSTIAIFLIVGCFGATRMAHAEGTVLYPKGALLLDSDLDGLTDEGEKQLYGTQVDNPDSDGDGWFDGAEVLSGSDPNDPSSPNAERLISALETSDESPLAWYMARATGLVAFLLLYMVMFLGLAIRLPLKRFISPVYSLSTHHWLSIHALVFALLHAILFRFDAFIGFSFADIFIPLHASFQPVWVALGIIAFYSMVIVIVTSVWKHLFSQRLWRITHFLNILLYVLVVVHAYVIGTDLKDPLIRDIFIVMNEVLFVLIVWNMGLKVRGVFLGRRTQSKTPDKL